MADASLSGLGFTYGPVVFRTDQRRDVRRACFRVRKVLEGLVHDTVALEGNPFTLEFNEAMIRFYDSQDGTEKMRFMAGCSLDPQLRTDVEEGAK
ncbi:MAG: hypothetical protein OXG82_16380 [Gammaproteobacteria bacterium]|nr:hypothetical protein [Gammaproteobacteria bacterium]